MPGSLGALNADHHPDYHRHPDPIRHLCEAISTRRGRGADAVAMQRNSLSGSLSNASSTKSLEEWDEPLPKVDGDDEALAEAPVWVVSPGSEELCAGCKRRLVFSAEHTQPGRVFSRSFPSENGSSSSSLASCYGGSSASSSQSGASDGSLARGGSRWRTTPATPPAMGAGHPTAAALGGFRVVAGGWGQQWAEFELVVSSGASVQRAWRSHADVARLMETVGVARRARTMPNTNLAWELVQRHGSRWFGATETLYLIEKRGMLDVLFEQLLYEMETPTQLQNFVDDATWGDDRGGAPPCSCTASEATASVMVVA